MRAPLLPHTLPRASFFQPAFWSAVGKLKKRRFDTAIFFHRSKTKVWLAKLAGIPQRWGSSAPGREKLLTRACPAPILPLHRTDALLFLLNELGIPSDGRRYDLIPDPLGREELETVFRENGISPDEPYAVVHPGGNWELKRWPEAHFARWIELYLKEFGGKVILCGTRPEEGIAVRIRSCFESDSVVSLCGKTSIDALVFLLKDAVLLLSNDSGPIHLAASQGTKIVGVYGPTSPAGTGPVSDAPAAILWKNVGCEVPCYFRSCNHRICMDWMKPEEVFEKTKVLLRETRPVPHA